VVKILAKFTTENNNQIMKCNSMNTQCLVEQCTSELNTSPRCTGFVYWWLSADSDT